jgi:predicted  nucleic acid-binding Zn-ribbon protein
LAEGTERSTEIALSQIREMVASNASLTEQVNNLTSERDALNEQVTSLNDKVTNLTARAEIGTTYLASLREEAVNMYKKVTGDKADEAIINMLSAETTSHQTVKSLLADYTHRLEEKFPMQCQKCGSHDVSRASSQAEPEEQQNSDDNNKPTIDSNSDLAGRIYRRKMQK